MANPTRSYPPIYAEVATRVATPQQFVGGDSSSHSGLQVATPVATYPLQVATRVATKVASGLTSSDQLLLASNARLTQKKLPPPAVYISPSQLGVYDSCRRKWAWENIAGFRSPPTRSQILGTRVHSVLESWLKHGVPPDRKTLEGRIALKGLHHLPPPGAGGVEEKFYLTTRSGLHFHGIADWMGWNSQLGAVVIDHKTTSALKWAKTQQELEYDVQALLYAIFACISMQTDRVTLRWNYLQTNAKDAKLVETTLHLGQIIERFPIVEKRAFEMTAHRREKTHPLRVLPNPSVCAEYGGCPHQQRCRLTPTETMEAIMANEQNGTMRDHMQSLQNYRPPNAEGVFPPPPPPAVYGSEQPAPITNYLPPGPTQLHAPAQAAPQQPQFQQPPQQPQFQQPPQQPQFQQPPAQPQSVAEPFYQDPSSGYLIDVRTRQMLPANHPAYQYPDSFRQYMVAPPSLEQPPVLGGAANPQAGLQQPPQIVGQIVPGNPPPQQFPNYPPNAGPNAPEQGADPAQIPAAIATPPLHVEGVTDTKKKGRRSKAQIEADNLAAAGGSRALEMQRAAAGTLGDTSDGERLAFIEAMNGALSNPSLQLQTVTVEQLEYVGNLARAAFAKAFG